MDKYANELKEVHVILNTLVEEDYNKIPKSKLQLIEENMNKDYKYEINSEIALEENPMLEGTRALLYNIFRDYLATEGQCQKIKRMQAEDRIKIEKEKSSIYITNVFEKNTIIRDDNELEETKQMTIYKESIFSRIIKNIKNFFKH